LEQRKIQDCQCAHKFARFKLSRQMYANIIVWLRSLHWRHQLWGTGARAPLELGYVEKFGSFYVHNIHCESEKTRHSTHVDNFVKY